MSVPVRDRKKSQFDVLNIAHQLAIYTINICCNENVFLPKYREAITNDLISDAKNIYKLCRAANRIKIKSRSAKDRLELHPKKTRIFSLTRGLTFLGFEYHVSRTGQTYMLLAPAKTKETRKKLVKMVHLAKKGVIGRADCDNTYQQYRNYVMKGKSHKLLVRMDKFYKNLWIEKEDIAA